MSGIPRGKAGVCGWCCFLDPTHRKRQRRDGWGTQTVYVPHLKIEMWGTQTAGGLEQHWMHTRFEDLLKTLYRALTSDGNAEHVQGSNSGV